MSLARPALNFPVELLLKAQGIRVAFFTANGVLTDGSRDAHGSNGSTRLDSQDCLGLQLLQKAGIMPVVMAFADGPGSHSFAAMLKGLGVQAALTADDTQVGSAEKWLHDHSLSWQQVAMMGADWPDLAVMQHAAFNAAPAGAHAEVRAAADYISPFSGGHGAVRAVCDLLMVASGRYAGLLAEYRA